MKLLQAHAARWGGPALIQGQYPQLISYQPNAYGYKTGLKREQWQCSGVNDDIDTCMEGQSRPTAPE